MKRSGMFPSEGPESVPPALRPKRAITRSRGLMFLTASLFLSWTVWSTAILPRLEPVLGAAHAVRAVGIRLLLWVLPSAIYLWWMHGRRALAPLRLNLPPTARHWAASASIITLASLAVSIDVGRKLQLPPLDVWQRLLSTYTFRFPTAPLFEELIFRGVILAELLALLRAKREAGPMDTATRLRAWLANITASVLFTGLHWPWWIYTKGVGTSFWHNSAGVFLISLVLGMLFVRSRSLWPCVLLHWLNNLLSAMAPG